jgi:Fic family protein
LLRDTALSFNRARSYEQQATLALGRLDGLAAVLPDPDLFIYSYVRKEAVLSSQIEGTQSSLSDLLLFKSDALPGVPLEDVQEVSNYVAAIARPCQALGNQRASSSLNRRQPRQPRQQRRSVLHSLRRLR